MFGFQRVGDLLWALADSRGRGILCGCTAGRTTLNGEGLQHQDGHSLLLASTVPSVAAYDPAFAYEVGVIVEDAISRMTGEAPEDRYWYITLYNENYPMPTFDTDSPRSAEVREGIIRGLYRFEQTSADDDRSTDDAEVEEGRPRATILFSGTAWQAAATARRLLADDWGVDADLWSATSYKSLREEAMSTERWNRLHPGQPGRVPYVAERLAESDGPIVAVTDFMRSVPDQVARWMPRRFLSLGTDGFGRSDTRDVLRRFFEVDAGHIVIAVLSGLAADGAVPESSVVEALCAYGVEADLPDPWST
jgi:pyruvate dehydrogenase E1 component